MVLTRFTVEGKGIFRALQKLFDKADMSVADEQDLFDAEEVFERDLEVPDIYQNGVTKSTAWFTELGMKEFEEALDTILYYADLYLEAPIKKESMEYDGDVLYKDCYQVVLAA